MQCTGGGDALCGTAAACEQRGVQGQRDGAGVDAAFASTDNLITATQGNAVEAGEALLARPQDQGGGVQREAAGTVACCGQVGAAVLQCNRVALDDDVAAMTGEGSAVEGQRSQARRTEIDRLVEVKARVAAQRQVF
ncbi:hypothetical protein D3C87_1141430 [compost metagenome]